MKPRTRLIIFVILYCLLIAIGTWAIIGAWNNFRYVKMGRRCEKEHQKVNINEEYNWTESELLQAKNIKPLFLIKK